jgi:hypothetical protein
MGKGENIKSKTMYNKKARTHKVQASLVRFLAISAIMRLRLPLR